jgi:hypothetical protein
MFMVLIVKLPPMNTITDFLSDIFVTKPRSKSSKNKIPEVPKIDEMPEVAEVAEVPKVAEVTEEVEVAENISGDSNLKSSSHYSETAEFSNSISDTTESTEASTESSNSTEASSDSSSSKKEDNKNSRHISKIKNLENGARTLLIAHSYVNITNFLGTLLSEIEPDSLKVVCNKIRRGNYKQIILDHPHLQIKDFKVVDDFYKLPQTTKKGQEVLVIDFDTSYSLDKIPDSSLVIFVCKLDLNKSKTESKNRILLVQKLISPDYICLI